MPVILFTRYRPSGGPEPSTAMLANSLYLKLFETVVSSIVGSSVLNVKSFVETTAQFIHHTGHIVRDMDAALDVYRRLGFDCGAPMIYPSVPAPPS